MSTWYEVSGWQWGLGKINVVQVERHTENSVWMKGRRNWRITYFSRYFPSWSEARDFVIERALRNLRVCQESLEAAETKYSEACQLPESPP